MFRHNLVVIYRNFLRYKASFFINLTGLSIGLACTLFIYLWIQSEVNVDRFHEHEGQLVQVMENVDYTDEIVTRPETPDLLAEALVDEYPEIAYGAPMTHPELFGKFTLSISKDNALKAAGSFTGKDYFKMFSFDLLHGDRNNVLDDKKAIVISESLANKLFGTTDNVVGKSIDWNLPFYESQSQVSGIFKDLPESSTESFDFMVPFDVFKDLSDALGRKLHWDNHAPYTYLMLKDGKSFDDLNGKVTNFIKARERESNVSLFLHRYADNYLHGNFENGKQTGGRIEYVQLFAIIAFFILLMACINFMNLSTAKASRRVTEVGVKKAIGADRRMLISQYLSESFIMTTVAFVLSLVVVYLLLPSFNYITGKELSLALNGSFFLYALAIIAVTSFLAGSYPAFYLSGFNPAIVLKGNFDTSSLGGQFARKGLVLFQFMLSIILIVSVLVVYKQIEFVQTQNLGYDKDNIVYFNKEGALAGNSEAFHNELRKIPGIKAASGIGEKIIGATSSTGGVEWEGKNPDEDVNFTNVVADYGLMETLGMEMKDGRSFAKEYGAEENKIIFNETAIDIMNLDNPVGKRITLLGEEKEIIGVVKDFHFESFYESVKPLFVQFNPEQSFMTMAKIEAGREKQAIASIEQLYRKFNPGFPFEFSFLDEDFQAQYVAEQRVASLSRYFALLAILISCLGLFGLAAFTTERRMKEIGIRKVLGASDVGIFYLLSKDFTKVVLFASVIALPISYFAIRSWLNGFAYRIDLKLWFFIVALLAALIIAWMTVASHALRAAKSDPVECIRT